jgi:hypothetical protein
MLFALQVCSAVNGVRLGCSPAPRHRGNQHHAIRAAVADDGEIIAIDDVIYHDELTRLDAHDEVDIHFTLTRGAPDNWQGYRRRSTARIRRPASRLLWRTSPSYGPPSSLSNSKARECSFTTIVVGASVRSRRGETKPDTLTDTLSRRILLLLLYAPQKLAQPTVVVPNVLRIDLPSAKAKIADVGLRLGDVVEFPSDATPVGIVMGRWPGPGQRVAPRTEMRLWVSEGAGAEARDATGMNVGRFGSTTC